MIDEDHFSDAPVLAECEFVDEMTNIRRKVLKLAQEYPFAGHPAGRANAVMLWSSDEGEKQGVLVFVAPSRFVAFNVRLPSGC